MQAACAGFFARRLAACSVTVLSGLLLCVHSFISNRGTLQVCNARVAQLISVQFEMISMGSEKPICAPPRLSDASPALPLKRFQCLSDDGPLSSFQGRSSSTSSFHASLLQPIGGVMSLALCPQVLSQTV